MSAFLNTKFVSCLHQQVDTCNKQNSQNNAGRTIEQQTCDWYCDWHSHICYVQIDKQNVWQGRQARICWQGCRYRSHCAQGI